MSAQDRDCPTCIHHTEKGCKAWICEYVSREQALRAVEAWEKAKAKLGNYSLYPINEWVGLKRAMKIVLETLGEETEDEQRKDT